MSKKILGTEPAFPTDRVNSQQGISKRFYAACAVMQGLCANEHFLIVCAEKADKIGCDYTELVVTASLELTDELLKREYNEQE